MGFIREGRRAPPFAVKDGGGNTVRLANFLGQKVVLYFYPKDMTPGCTVEAREFAKLHDRLRRAGAVVLGVSPDSEEQHRKFAEMHELRFKLLADTDGVGSIALLKHREQHHLLELADVGLAHRFSLIPFCSAHRPGIRDASDPRYRSR